MIPHRLWPAIGAIWLFASVMLCLMLAPAIGGLRFPDPDDAMRLLEVRDWIGGQSWWDVGQHRLNGGDYPMHWSRLVDLPLAAVMLIADPLVGTAASSRIAMTIVPLVTLLVVMTIVALITRRLAGDEEAGLALLLTPLSVPLIYQLRPMRIDHHGWQIVLAVAAVLVLIARSTARRGAVAGLCLAMLVTISLEGLPIAAVIAGVAALAWVIQPARRPFLNGLLSSFFASALLCHAATRGPAMFAASCDAVSPAWLAVLGVAAGSVFITTILPLRTPAARLGMLIACGGVSVATLLLLAPQCLQGPFAGLDPLVRSIWYDNVSEGLPLWVQTPPLAAMTIALPLVGLYGSVQALRRSSGDARVRWSLMLAVLVPAILLACLVNRAGATANALALPGAASLLLILLRRARAVPSTVPRIAATAGALIIVSPGLPVGAAMTIVHAPGVAVTSGPKRPSCRTFNEIRALDALPPSIIFVPLDVTPDLIATTRHHAISGGYHRNDRAMHDVLAAFTGTPAQAERIVRRSGASYIAGCPSLNETEIYRLHAPNGLWARLERGERFDWLVPVTLPRSSVLVWRVITPAPRRLRAEPGSS